MGVAMEIGVMRRLLAISIRRIYKSVCNHPFIVGVVCFLLFLYRSFPFLFSILVSACPVLVCTAALLGTLLSFGQSNIPEIEEEEEKVSHEISSLKARVIGKDSVVISDESLVVERFDGEKGDIVEKSDEDTSPLHDRLDKVEEEVGLVDSTRLMNESSREIQLGMPATKELQGEFNDLLKKRGAQLEAHMVDSILIEREDLEHHYCFILNKKDENIDIEEDDDESGSDGAESSSPDASMADISPLLCELHPLLDNKASPHAHLSHDGSDVASERSLKSDESGEESEDMENQAEEQDGEDEEDKVAQEGKKDGSKSAIKWTENDQKNLTDLGTSDLERNQCLENLMARRRADKDLSMMVEKNLIDLDSDDLPLSIPPVATTRRNPFDILYDTYANVPGSAPSVLLPRRNPFDLPYDLGEEKTDLKDSFRQEFTSMQPREPIFRRHESFGVGPSVLGSPRQENQDFKWRPYFVTERFATDGVSYTSFQQQLSGVSESKTSSVPDTESMSSTMEDEGKNNNENYFSQETDAISNIDNASVQVEHGSQSSEVDYVDIDQIEGMDVLHDVEEITLGDVESHHEMGSSLSEAERLDTYIGELASYHKVDLSLPEAGEPAIAVDVDASENYLNTEPFEECSSRLSLSSLSEVDERISNTREEGSTALNQVCDHTGESGISTQLTLDELEFQFISGAMDENRHKETVYDSSSPAVEMFSFSSISSDTLAVISEMSPIVFAASAEAHFKLHAESTQTDASVHEEVLVTSSEVSEVHEHNVEKDESSGVNANCDNGGETMVPESGVDHVVVDSGSSSDGSEDKFMNAKEENYSYEQDQLSLSSLQEGNVGEHLHSTTSSNHLTSDDLTMSSPNDEQLSLMVENVSVDLNVLSFETESVEEHVAANGEAIHHEGEQVHSLCSSDNEEIQEATTHKDENVQLHLDEYQSPSYDSQIHVEGHQDAGQKVDILPSGYMKMASDKPNLSTSEYVEHVVASVQEPLPLSIDVHDQLPVVQEQYEVLVESPREVGVINNENVWELHDPVVEVSNNSCSLISNSTSVPSESSSYRPSTGVVDLEDKILDSIVYEDGGRVSDEHYLMEDHGHPLEQNITGKADELRYIDERLLSELDRVGDSRVNKVGESISDEQISEETSVGNHGKDLFVKDSDPRNVSQQLPVLQVISIEDVDLALVQLHERSYVEAVNLPSMVENQLVVDEPEHPMDK